MRYIILWAAIALATCPALASEAPKHTPPKEQWVEITKPVMGCATFGGNLDDNPELIPAIESEKIVDEKGIKCSPMQIGEKYLLDSPAHGYTTLITFVCPHCAPYAYPVYTKAKGEFYKNISQPEFYKAYLIN